MFFLRDGQELQVSNKEDWVLYVLICSDGTLYTGVSNNLEKRLIVHNSGKGSKYTRSRLPCFISAKSSFYSRSACLKAEIRFKKLSRKEKLKYLNLGLDCFFEDRREELFPKNLDTDHDQRESDRD